MRKSDRVRREVVYNTGGKNKKNRGRVRSRSCRARRVALRRRFFFLRSRTSNEQTSEREAYVAAARTGVWGRSNQPGRKSRQREVILLPTGATFEWCARLRLVWLPGSGSLERGSSSRTPSTRRSASNMK